MTVSPSTSAPPAPCTWWSDRWAWRGALGAAPLGALAAILYALIVLRTAPTDALMAYLLGAALASGIGCLLAGSFGASVETVRYRLRLRAAAAEQDEPDELDHEPAHAAPAAEQHDVEQHDADQHDDARPAHAVAA